MTDDLALRRRCLADFRALATQDPALYLPVAHARLYDYICQQIASEGYDMPAKDYRTLGEDLANVAVRLPQSVIDRVDAHIATLRTMSPWARVGRSEALRDLVLRGLGSLDPQAPLAPVPIAQETPQAVPVRAPAPPVPQVQHPLPPAPATPVPQADAVQTPETAPSGAPATEPETAQRERRRAQVLAAIPAKQEHSAGRSPGAIREATGFDKIAVDNDLRFWLKRGDIAKTDKGQYVRLR